MTRDLCDTIVNARLELVVGCAAVFKLWRRVDAESFSVRTSNETRPANDVTRDGDPALHWHTDSTDSYRKPTSLMLYKTPRQATYQLIHLSPPSTTH